MKKFSTKLLSLFLCLVLLLNLLEPAAHAEGTGDNGDLSSQELITEDPGELNLFDPDVEEILDDSELSGSPEALELDLENPYEGIFDETVPEISDDTILSEETERREENVRHVRLSGGALAALQYNYPIFEKNSEDEWVEIDNRLQAVKNDDGINTFHVDRQDFSLDFYETPQDSGLLKISLPEGDLGWGLMVPENRPSSIESTYTPLPLENEDSLLYSKSVSGLLEYTGLLPETRLSYQLTGYDIKEDLILESPEALSENGGSFRFALDPGEYTVLPKDEQTLEILDAEENPLVSISAPMMRDAAGNVSFDLQLALEDPEENTTRRTVRLTASEAWLTAEDRAWPVTIDPTVQMTYSSFSDVSTATVYSLNPTIRCQGDFAVGRDYTNGNIRTYIRPQTLPTLKSSDAVIAAAFSATAMQYSQVHTGPIYINLHAMTTALDLSEVSWNTTQNAYNETVIDRQMLTETEITGQQQRRLSWDVTRLVRDWYINDSNYGFILITENESSSSLRNATFCSETSHAGMPDEARPALTVTYLNQEGLEPYLTTHGSGSATMGSLQVNDFTGNLVYTYTDISMDGAYMPITLAHVFSHSKRLSEAVVGGGAYYGKGVRLNLSMKVASSSVSGYPYTLTDGDGTIHYFSLKSGTSGAEGSVYEKEFESTTLLTKTSSGFTLDNGGTLLYYFNTDGYLKSIKDITNNKTQTLTYTGGRLTKVTDGAQREVSLTYNSSGYLTSVTDPAGRSTSYTYNSSNQLTCITRPDNTYVELEYSGTWLVKVKDIDGTAIGISYWSTTPHRVKRLLEYGADGSEGGKLTWTYTPGATKVTDRQTRSETMLFDNAGHTVCVRDGEGNAVFGKYNNTDPDKKNALLYASGMQGSVTNYLKNHGFEDSLTNVWSAYNSNTEGSFSGSTELPREGAKSLKITSTGTTNSYGVYQKITVPDAPGKTLTFSAWLNLSNYAPSGSYGFCLNIRYQNASGDWVTNLSSPVPAADGWQRQSWTVKVPSDASSDTIWVVFQFYRQTGTCYVDKAQLEEGAVSNRYNLLKNGHFREAAGTTAVGGWTRVNLDSTDKTAEGHTGNGYSITGVSTKDKRLTQTINICNGQDGDNYVFSAWAKAEAIPAKDLLRETDRDFAVRLVFVRSDGTTQESLHRFEAKTAGWQYLSGSAIATQDYVSVRFELLYQKQKNTVIFDDACLYRERFGDRMTYDDEGRVETITDRNGKVIRYTYLAAGRPEISRVKYPDGTTTDYTYDSSTRRLLTATDASGKTVTYSYDPNGNAKEAKTTIDGTSLSSGVTTYSGSYVSTVKDPFGYTTTYTYNQNKGLLTTLTNAKGVETAYTYDTSNDYLTKVETGTSKVTYAYNSGRLSSLTHNTSDYTSGNVAYGLTYDTFGTRTGVKVGTQNLVTYTYKDNNGDLKKTTYGNGQYSEPGYDSLGRVTSMKYNGTTAYKFYYGTTGRIGLEEDIQAGTWRRFSYDQGGRLTSLKTGNGETHKYAYNSKGELSSSSYTTAASGQVKTVYTYGNYNTDSGERVLKKLNIHSSRFIIDYDYDSFYRAGNTITLSSGASLATTYTFRSGTGTNATSVMPKSQTQVMKDQNGTTTDTLTTNYTYDSLGNIVTVKEGTVQKLKYYYDNLNQLTREDNKYLNKTITYTYDLGGNLKTVTEYAYQTGETVTGTATATKSYTYGDSNWKDKLTAYKGNTITYDAIGNPLQYHNGYTFTWQRGRQLATANNGTNSISYAYNSDGIRTSKTVNGTTANYVLEGTKVVFETDGTTDIWYYYNAAGAPVGFRTNVGSGNVLYLYRKNLQGDITGIYRGFSGELMVSYSYDAWGKVTATNVIGTSTGTTLINRNPYLYRGYRYDRETGLYYLNSRYYDPETGRFINADIVINTGQNTISANMFQFCGNNPISRLDYTGQSWLHWLLGAAVVIGCAAATVVTCGGFAAAAGTVAAVVGGSFVASTSSAVAAGAFIGSSVVYGIEVFQAASTSSSLEEYANKGNWGTVIKTTAGGAVGAGCAFLKECSLSQNESKQEAPFESRGSTAKIQPSNLSEQLALEEVKSNPNGEIIQGLILQDSRWPASEGWLKAQVVRDTFYSTITIHYNYNQVLSLFDDFKIVNIAPK